jgi:acetyl/propionyl-CoA carboxylase alpha subunit
MLAKIVAWGEDRETAVRRLLYALQTTTLFGLVTNMPFLQDILRHPAFQSGSFSTHFIEQHLPNWQPPSGDLDAALIAASLAQFQQHPQLATNSGYWRNNPNTPLCYRYSVISDQLSVSGGPIEVYLTPARHQANTFSAAIQNSEPFTIHNPVLNNVEWSQFTIHNSTLSFTLNTHHQTLPILLTQTHAWIQTRTGTLCLEIVPLLPVPQHSAMAGGSLRAPMPGSVLAVLVEVGEHVSEGQPLMKLEAMKMEHTICTAVDGIVEAIYFEAGDTVEADVQLLLIGDVDAG